MYGLMPQFPIIERHLPYVSRLNSRITSSVDMVVIHCTELPDLEAARDYGEKLHYQESGTGNSGHFYIERSGKIEQWVPIDRIAHHVRGHNETSIGIELDNRGRFPDWFDSRNQDMTQVYSDTQLDALIALLEQLQTDCPSLQWIAGHQDLDSSKVPSSDRPAIMVPRKMDPGPLFPWKKILASTSLTRLSPDSSSL
jgi:N-acetylmuramoyl-L-alanine amidase